MLAKLALRSPYRSAVRELPDERTIEHGCHSDEHDADDDLCPRFGFAVLRCRIGRPGNARPSAARVGRTRALTPGSVPGSSFLAAPCWRDRATRRQMAGAGRFVH